MDSPSGYTPSPAPWLFAEHLYGIAHCLVDRDGRVIGVNLPICNGPLLEAGAGEASGLSEGQGQLSLMHKALDVVIKT